MLNDCHPSSFYSLFFYSFHLQISPFVLTSSYPCVYSLSLLLLWLMHPLRHTRYLSSLPIRMLSCLHLPTVTHTHAAIQICPFLSVNFEPVSRQDKQSSDFSGVGVGGRLEFRNSFIDSNSASKYFFLFFEKVISTTGEKFLCFCLSLPKNGFAFSRKKFAISSK